MTKIQPADIEAPQQAQQPEIQVYGISKEKLVALNENKDMEALKECGGVDGLAKILSSDTHSGLDPHCDAASPGSVAKHRDVFGPNKFMETPPKNFFVIVWETLQDPILLLLCAAAALSTILGAALPEERAHNGWIEGVAIWVAVVLVTMVGAGNDYQKDLQFRKLNAQKDVIHIKVLRGGQQVLVLNTEIVVGDVMLLDTGDKVAADGITISTQGLVIDEASLTGESDPIKKTREEDPWVRSGTQVSEGSGAVLVVAVGESSEWGKTMALVGEAGDDETPLQQKLGDVAAAVGKIGFGVAIACFFALLIKWCIVNKGFPISEVNNNGPVQFFLYAITIIVVAVPEGLPLAVTISLAYSMKKMMKDNNFVRVLAACETMGGATAICSDKTGTLTENRMTVVEGWFANQKFDHAPMPNELPAALLNELKMNACLNSKAFLVEQDNSRVDFVGNRTECALLMLIRSWAMDYNTVRQDNEENLTKLYGFSSAKKMASALVKLTDKYRLYNKGAAEWVLNRSVSLVNEHGDVIPLTEEKKTELLDVVVAMAKRGLRCICLTYTDIPLEAPDRPADFFEDSENVDKDLIVLGFVGIKDPVRKEVPAAVETCKKAGITVRMVTGDNIHTAQHIARECGILFDADHVAMEGPVFRNMAATELIPLLPKLRVLARSSPEDKLTLVGLLKKEGDVVAVTGDGTNDAPALKESDVGLAMGIAGTEVAKEAADIVILDDNFSSIVKSVLWGRSVFNNIRKFLQFQLTVNLVALVISFVGAVVGGHEPLNVLQLLWVNLIMDTMGALALATEDPNPELLDQKPHGHEEALINSKMWKHIVVQGCYQLFWMFVLLYGLPNVIDHYAITKPGDYYEAHCIKELDSKFGVNTTMHTYGCNIMTNCGFPYGGLLRQSSQCWLYRDVYDPLNQLVPSKARDAVCYGIPADQPCENYNLLKKYQEHMEKQYKKQEDEDYKNPLSILFNAFIMTQVFNEINARRINDEYTVFEGFFTNPIFLSVIAVTIGFQILIMETPLNMFFKVHGLTWSEWLATIAIGLGAIPVSLATRFLTRNWPAWLVKPPRSNSIRRSGSYKTPSRIRTLSK